MEDLSEKEFRIIFEKILKHIKKREPVIRFAFSSGWSQRELEMASFESLEMKLFWVLHKCSIESLLYLETNGLLNRDPVNEITSRVLKIKKIYDDKRFNSFKRDERK